MGKCAHNRKITVRTTLDCMTVSVVFILSIWSDVIGLNTMIIGLKQCPILCQLSLFFCLYYLCGGVNMKFINMTVA